MFTIELLPNIITGVPLEVSRKYSLQLRYRILSAIPSYFTISSLSWPYRTFWMKADKKTKANVLNFIANNINSFQSSTKTLWRLAYTSEFIGYDKRIWYFLISIVRIDSPESYATFFSFLEQYIAYALSIDLIRDTLELTPSVCNILGLLILCDFCRYTQGGYIKQVFTSKQTQLYVHVMERYLSIFLYCLSEEERQKVLPYVARELKYCLNRDETLSLTLYHLSSPKIIYDLLGSPNKLDPVAILCLYYHSDRKQRHIYWRSFCRWYKYRFKLEVLNNVDY